MQWRPELSPTKNVLGPRIRPHPGDAADDEHGAAAELQVGEDGVVALELREPVQQTLVGQKLTLKNIRLGYAR